MENEQSLYDKQSTADEQAPLHRCGRCHAILYGKYCGVCGLPAGGYVPYTQPPKKKKRWVALWVTLGVILLIGVNIGLYSISPFSAMSMPEGDYDGEYYPEDSPYYGDDDGFEFGYTNETSHLRVDALGTIRMTGKEEFLAPEGKEYLIVNLRLTNRFDDIVAYDSANFELCCGKGNLVPVQYTDIDTPTALNYGRLLPQGEVEGSVVFLIPKGDTNLELFMYDYEDAIRFPLL